MAERDFRIAHRIDRVFRVQGSLLSKLRVAGIFYWMAGALLAHFSYIKLHEGWIYPKLLMVCPVAFLLGGWLLFDAKAIADGSRRYQAEIELGVACVGAASGLALVFALTGSLFP